MSTIHFKMNDAVVRLQLDRLTGAMVSFRDMMETHGNEIEFQDVNCFLDILCPLIEDGIAVRDRSKDHILTKVIDELCLFIEGCEQIVHEWETHPAMYDE